MATVTPHPDPRPRYDMAGREMATPTVSKVERALLCDLLTEVGPHAPTLSGEWDTHHLAAHLVIREANPIGGLKRALASRGDAAVEQRVAGTDFAALVDLLRAGPPLLSLFRPAGLDRAFNTLEFVVHHEDVRRAPPDWTPRSLPRWAEDQIWARLRVMARLVMKRSAVPVRLVRADGGGESTARKGSRPAVIRALPSEIALFAHGRAEVARVELDGPPDAMRRLHEATFSV